MEISNKATLLKILDAIDFQDDKDAFVKQFTELIYMQSVSKLIMSLPDPQQELIKKELKENQEDLGKIGEILKTHFDEEQMKKSLEEITMNAVSDWMKAVTPTLSSKQKQKLFVLSKELNSTSHSILDL